MRSKHRPADSLADIIENAETIEEYTSTMDRASYENHRLTRDAVERCLERICEATHRLGDFAEQKMPGHPWGRIRGFGNWLRHGYDRLDPEIIWNVIRNDLPSIITAVRAALADLNDHQADQQS